MGQFGFYYNSNVCSGCKTCQVACKDKNDHNTGMSWRRVHEVTAGNWVQHGNSWTPEIIAYNISMSCNHCDDPGLHECLSGKSHF